MTLLYSGTPGLAVPGGFVPGLPLPALSPFVPVPSLKGAAVVIAGAGPLAALAGISPAGPLAASASIAATGPGAAMVTITVP